MHYLLVEKRAAAFGEDPHKAVIPHAHLLRSRCVVSIHYHESVTERYWGRRAHLQVKV